MENVSRKLTEMGLENLGKNAIGQGGGFSSETMETKLGHRTNFFLSFFLSSLIWGLCKYACISISKMFQSPLVSYLFHGALL